MAIDVGGHTLHVNEPIGGKIAHRNAPCEHVSLVAMRPALAITEGMFNDIGESNIKPLFS